MNFFVFTIVVLIAIQGAYAIKCYKCQPDYANIVSAVNKGNISGLNLCSNPTGTVDCSQDPNSGSLADACYTISVGLTYNISLLNLHGEIKYYTLACTVKSMCPNLKKSMCGQINTTFAGVPGLGISHCGFSCCEGDLCNNPSGSPATSPSGSPATSPSASPSITPSGSPTIGIPTSSVKSAHIPPNAAIFGILGWVTVHVAFMSMF